MRGPGVGVGRRGAARSAALCVAALVGLAACSGEDAQPLGPSTPHPDARTLRCTQEFGDTAASAYVLPFPVGRTYRLIQGYCAPNPTWGHHAWLAYDFDLSIGDTVVASRPGHVLAARDSFEDGSRVCGEENYVFVEHEDGTVMAYIHLTRHGALVGPGQEVDEGEPIGLSGDSGCSSGPHLHVALFRDRTSYDVENNIPLNYRRAAGPLDTRHGLMQGQSYTALP